MEQENIIAKVILQARNLYKTDFDPNHLPQQTKERILKLKLSTEFKNTIQHIKKEKSKEKPTHQHRISEKNKNHNLNKNQEQNPEKGVSSIQAMVKEFLAPKTTEKINTFQKFDKNISTIQVQQKSKQPAQLQVAVRKLQMNLSQETRLGTIKATNLRKLIKPTWHAPFKLYRVIVGHQGWVRCLAVSPENQYFATGSADRTIKFWDLASGQLKISLTGHINTVRGLQFSKYHPYLFSCGEDKSVKCWDLQMNKVIRNYHGHLSGVYCLKIHHGLNVLITGGRDSAARVWDIRIRKQIHCLTGHAHTVGSVITLQNEPVAITGSYDSFVKVWDIGMGKCLNTMTNHKKAIRTMVENPFQYSFATAASDNIKVWKSPHGQFLRNMSGHHSIIDSMAINQDGVLVSGGNDGSMKFWDWSSGYCFQDAMSKPQPGSIAAENGIFAMTFDRSGTRLITGQCDKTIKMWRQDSNATQQTHPIKSFNMEFK